MSKFTKQKLEIKYDVDGRPYFEIKMPPGMRLVTEKTFDPSACKMEFVDGELSIEFPDGLTLETNN